ncbi:MAG: Uncharacterized protein CEN92_176 [Candidatus Berkelbacteria bacterium Licking1014_96]|uniref:DUF304 domain-containing protein n=1 Tax=Candidatus Berkelbacteria bacterium Licking1014_96 TaxID=2017149 RepID=A0A554LG59_9BACT|nr:MAG: Uncharacterized protein CEN92_176 [Candidatus Berkelbacteria bacterium Licking1014_96]
MKNKPFFPGQEKDEEVVFFTRRHPLSFLGILLFAFFMAVLPFALYLLLTAIDMISLDPTGQKIMLVLASSYLLFVLGFFLAGWIDYYLDVMILTDSRIVDITQNVLFSRTVAEANLTDIEDVNAEVKGILPTLFHFGTVFVQTAGTARNFEFKSLPDPYAVSKMILDLHEKSLLEEEKRESREIGRSVAREEEKKCEHSHHQEAKEEAEEVPKLPPIKPQGEPKPNIEQKEDDNSVNQEDLEKGGGADF